MITRRFALAGMGASAAFGGLTPVLARASVSLGGMTITSLSDGYLTLPGSFFFEGLPEAEVNVILAEHGLSADQMEPPCNVTLMQDGTHTVLFDVGAGPGFMPSAGALTDNLEAAGVAPEDVTHVIFTHGHPDHLWGLLDDFDEPVFANAAYMMSAPEWAYWTDPATVEHIGEARAGMAVGAARRLDTIADTVTLIEDGAELLPGVTAIASHGHTPGHTSFELRSGDKRLLVVGDAIGNAHVALARPDWPSGADQDAGAAIATRLMLLERLAKDGMPMLGFHFPEGGIGRIEMVETGYRFLPGEM